MTLRHITLLKVKNMYRVVVIFNTCSIYTSFLINVHIISSDSAGNFCINTHTGM